MNGIVVRWWGGRKADFICGDPLAVAHLIHGDHARSESVVGEDDIVDGGRPSVAVAGSAMSKLLTIKGVGLVRVVDDELVFVCMNKRFPNTWRTIGGVGRTGGHYSRDIAPGKTAIVLV